MKLSRKIAVILSFLLLRSANCSVQDESDTEHRLDKNRQLDAAACVYCKALATTGITDSLAVDVSDALVNIGDCTNKQCVREMDDFCNDIRLNEEKYKRITKDQSVLLRDFIKEVTQDKLKSLNKPDTSTTCVYCKALEPTGIKDSLANIVSEALVSLENCPDEKCVKDMLDFCNTIRDNEERYHRITPEQSKLLEKFIAQVTKEKTTRLEGEERAEKEAARQGKKSFEPASVQAQPTTSDCPYCSILDHAEFLPRITNQISAQFAQMSQCETEHCVKDKHGKLQDIKRKFVNKGKINSYQEKMLEDLIKKATDEKIAAIRAAKGNKRRLDAHTTL